MQTVRQHLVARLAHKKTLKIRDWETDKYTSLGGEFTAQSNIHDGPFPQRLKVVSYFPKKALSQMFVWALYDLPIKNVCQQQEDAR